jgi:hypothetical protein
MSDRFPLPQNDRDELGLGMTLCISLAEEIRMVLTEKDGQGTGLVWLVAKLTADQPRLQLVDVARLICNAFLNPAARAVWDHARGSGDPLR